MLPTSSQHDSGDHTVLCHPWDRDSPYHVVVVLGSYLCWDILESVSPTPCYHWVWGPSVLCRVVIEVRDPSTLWFLRVRDPCHVSCHYRGQGPYHPTFSWSPRSSNSCRISVETRDLSILRCRRVQNSVPCRVALRLRTLRPPFRWVRGPTSRVTSPLRSEILPFHGVVGCGTSLSRDTVVPTTFPSRVTPGSEYRRWIRVSLTARPVGSEVHHPTPLSFWDPHIPLLPMSPGLSSHVVSPLRLRFYSTLVPSSRVPCLPCQNRERVPIHIVVPEVRRGTQPESWPLLTSP